MDDAVKRLARLPPRVVPSPDTAGMDAYIEEILSQMPDEQPIPPHAGEDHPGPARRAVTRHGWNGRLHRGDPFTNARRAAHPGPTPAKAHPGPARHAVPRHGWDGRLHRGDPFINAGQAAHPDPTPALREAQGDRCAACNIELLWALEPKDTSSSALTDWTTPWATSAITSG